VIGIESAEIGIDLRDAERVRFADDVRRGFAARPRVVPAKWLYDARGSALFDLICEQPEYYLPRIESALLREHGRELAEAIGPDALVFEYGAGSARKTALLLAALARPAGYVPVDISREALLAATETLGRRFPRVPIRPVVADFTEPLRLPLDGLPAARRVAFFPGSTIGNFEPHEAVALLHRMAIDAGPGGALVVGVDHPKDETTLVRAYDDARGVTAAFGLNLLARMNRELGGDFRLSLFRHRAIWEARRSRVETHLEALEPMVVQVAGGTFRFEAGQTIHTENAYKWEPRAFDALAAIAGWRPERTFADERAWFGVKVYRTAAS
jgi:L-histidine N-alpha-methyltransferase